MDYKKLKKLNEIIENLKAHPNADENIQFVLRLAQESITRETLNNLIENVKPTALMQSNEEQDNQAKFGLKFTTKEIDQMPKTFKKELPQILPQNREKTVQNAKTTKYLYKNAKKKPIYAGFLA